MDVDRPEAAAAARALLDRYEAALMANDTLSAHVSLLASADAGTQRA